MSNTIILVSDTPSKQHDEKSKIERNIISSLRVQRVRSLFALGHEKSAVKRICSQEWGIKRRCVEKYITRARQSNGERLEETPQETLATSLHYWSTKLQEAEKRQQESTASIRNLEGLIEQLQPEQTTERESIKRLLEWHRKRFYGAFRDSIDIYDRIDRLRGHVHSGGSASVTVLNQINNHQHGGGLSQQQRLEQLEAIGMLPAQSLPPVSEPFPAAKVNGKH